MQLVPRRLFFHQKGATFLLLILFFASSFLSSTTSMSAEARQDPNSTHYQVLELEPTASLQDIKKAYRRLALLHHPDRNPPEKKDQATVKFRQVNEAYEVLSDADQRRHYDRDLKQGGGRPRPTSTSSNGGGGSSHQFHRRQYRDPFHQFDDLFRNDPFFQEAFKDMDDLFAKTFQQQNGRPANTESGNRNVRQPPKSWGRRIAGWLGIDFEVSMSSTTIGPDGRPQTISQTHTTYGGNRNNRNQPTRTSGYTSKSTKTIMEHGQRVTIQSLEKDGNKIEEKYIQNRLVQRLINGIPEQQYQLDGGNTGQDL